MLRTMLPRVVVPTSNDYVRACEITCQLMAKYWQGHPIVDVLHFEQAPAMPGPGFNPINFGCQCDWPWVAMMVEYLDKHCRDDLVLLCLDDYALFQPVNDRAIDVGCTLLRSDPLIASFALTWQPVAYADSYQDCLNVLLFPQWPYAFNVQAGIWRRTDLLRILRGLYPGISIWNMEIEGTKWFHANMWNEGADEYHHGHRMAGWRCPTPANANHFVDSVDKTGWPFPYHNIMHRRQRDPRHDAFLKEEGLL